MGKQYTEQEGNNTSEAKKILPVRRLASTLMACSPPYIDVSAPLPHCAMVLALQYIRFIYSLRWRKSEAWGECAG